MPQLRQWLIHRNEINQKKLPKQCYQREVEFGIMPKFHHISQSTWIWSLNQATKYLCSSPRVHAYMEAILFVLVSCPFWWSRKCRVTVPWAASASSVLPSEDNCKFFVVKLSMMSNHQNRDSNLNEKDAEIVIF